MRIGFVELVLLLFIASITVGPNVALFVDRWLRRAQRTSAAAARRKAQLEAQARDLLAQMGLSERAGHYPHQLSGGQQQRVAIARALALHPDILCFDEPTSALDPGSTMKVEELMSELKKNYTVVIVTHNMQQAARISDRTAFFLLGELVECGPTSEIFSTPKDKRTEDYISGRFG